MLSFRLSEWANTRARPPGKHNVINDHTQSHTNTDTHSYSMCVCVWRRSLNLTNWPPASARHSLYLFGGAWRATKQHSHIHTLEHTHSQADTLIFKWVKLIKYNFVICERASVCVCVCLFHLMCACVCEFDCANIWSMGTAREQRGKWVDRPLHALTDYVEFANL